MRTRSIVWLALLLFTSAAFPASAQTDPFALEAAATAVQESPRRATGETSLAEAFLIQRHPETGELELFGSLIIWFLLALSAASLGLLGAMAMGNREQHIAPPETIKRATYLLSEKRYEELMETLDKDGSYFAKVLYEALTESAHGHTAMVRASEQTSDDHTIRRLRGIEPLNIIGNIAPMIGLFGTVYGMILAFGEIVASGGTPDPVGLAAGIGTALTTTFWGLVVAIPALSGYAFMRNRIEVLTVESSRHAEALVNTLRDVPGAPEGDPLDISKAHGAASGVGGV